MAIRKFLTSVADVYGYDQDDNLLFIGKTLVDSSIEVSLGSNPVRGGRGNQLQYVYYHTGEMNFTLTDTQWNLGLLGATVGSSINHDENIYFEENITLDENGKALVSETPLTFSGLDTDPVYGWSTNQAGRTSKFEFGSGLLNKTSTSALGEEGDVVCVRYYTASKALGESNSFTIKSNMIPSVVKLVMEAQLNSADVSTNKIGIVQIIAPRVTLSGAFSISMTADGIANTPLTGMALAYTDPASTTGACSTEPYYAKVVEIIDNSNWWDNVTLLLEGEPDNAISIAANGTYNSIIYAVPGTGSPYLLPSSELTFTSANANVATVDANGTISGEASGNTTVTAAITDSANAVKLDIAVTVTA